MPFDETMRVGYVLKRYPRYSETFIVNEILAHEAAGLEIEIFALRPANDTHFQDLISRVKAPVNYIPRVSKSSQFWTELVEASEDIHDIWTKLEAVRGETDRDLFQAVVLARHVRQRGITHLHAHFANVAAAIARVAAYFADIPFSFTAHAKDIYHESVDHDDLQGKLSNASNVITVSNYNLEYLRASFATYSEHIKCIYNGLDLKQYHYIPPRDRPERIISVGRLVEKKGLNDLVEACAILERKGFPFKCQIIGSGPLETELQVQIEKLGLHNHVELMGQLSRDQLTECVQDASVFAAPCVIGKDADRDGLPTVLMEAMALGTPCVSTDVTGIPEILFDEETGLMVPQHDPEALAIALERLMSDPDLRVALAKKARLLIEEKFNIHINAASIREVFRSINPVRIEIAGKVG